MRRSPVTDAPAPDPLAARLTEIREREQAATTGPWWFDEDELTWRLHGVHAMIPAQMDGLIPEQVMNHQILKAPKTGTPYAEYWPNEADAAFIVAARTDVPRLVKALEAALKLAADAKPMAFGSPADCTDSCAFGPCDCSGEGRPLGSWNLDPAALREAITSEMSGKAADGGS